MATGLDVVDFRCLAEPEVPIEFLRRGDLRERSADRIVVNAHRDFLDLAQQPFLHHVDGAEEQLGRAALLRADHHHLVGVLLAGVADQLVLFEGERQRLLAEDVLAGLEGLDGDFDVPVVYGVDAHQVDVVAIENLAVVAVGVGLALASFRVILGVVGTARVNVADGHDIGELGVLRRVPVGARSPTPIKPIRGRSFAEELANAFGLQAKYGAALPATAAAVVFFKKSRREH